MKHFQIILALLLGVFSISCQQVKKDLSPKIVYQTDELIITKLSAHVYEHTSFLKTASYGLVPCNGMFVTNQHETVVFDTPTDNTSATELINWIDQVLKSKIKAVIPTHFHEDCLGGLEVFKKHNIPSYALEKTIELAQKKQAQIPEHAFKNQLTLTIGQEKVHARFFGEGHTKDNIVGYFPKDAILFGGCLIKELNAGKGNVEDANETAWPHTVELIKRSYPNVKLVIPGHGEIGNVNLLDYTIEKFTPIH